MDEDELNVYLNQDEQIKKELEALKYDKLEFVKELLPTVDYMRDQKELIDRAKDITNGDPLNALKYIVSCLEHEGHSVELSIIYEICGFSDDLKLIDFETGRTIDNDEYEISVDIPIQCVENELGFYVNWGDGHISLRETKHAYKKQQNTVEYNIRIFGFGITGYGPKITDIIGIGNNHLKKVISFGNLGHTFTSLEYAFVNCVKLISVPNFLPPTITNLSHAFSSCIWFNQSVETWDTRNVTDMSGMFRDCFKFNKPLNSWNVESVTNMSDMFYECFMFNQPLNLWKVESVTDMSNMFCFCEEFNQDLSSWNIKSAINIEFMFFGCNSLDEVSRKFIEHSDNCICGDT
jgi:surface protein